MTAIVMSVGTHPAMSQTPDARTGDFEIEVFYDGDCPLCRRELRILKALDRKDRIRATDIAAEEFDPAPLGKSWSELTAEIHGRLPDGTWVTGVEVFRRLYAAVGCRTLTRISRWPLISHTLDFGYRLFARNRLRLTGRCDQSCSLDQRPAGGSDR
jgi:predicted DCC family thiol-disulfide oxidoreductase YuxK